VYKFKIILRTGSFFFKSAFMLQDLQNMLKERIN